MTHNQQQGMGGQSARPSPARDWWLTAGMAVSASAALVSSFDGLRSLAIAAGWQPLMAPLLPLCVDAYAMSATRVWLADEPSTPRARRFARWNAFGAIGLSLAGNATYHAIAAELMTVTWVVVVVVGAVPPTVLGLVTHLAALRRQSVTFVPEPGLSTAGESGDKPRPDTSIQDGSRRRSEAELLAEARMADAAYRAEYGKKITRDALRKALRVSGARASEVLRQLKAEAALSDEQRSV